MQLVIGIIIGIFLTIGTAYVMDSGKSAVCPPASVAQWSIGTSPTTGFPMSKKTLHPAGTG